MYHTQSGTDTRLVGRYGRKTHRLGSAARVSTDAHAGASMTEQRKTRTVYQQPPSSSGGPAPQLASALFSRPQYDLPDLPTNLTDLNDDVLMTLFSQYTGWMNFAATQLAEAEVTEAKAEAQVKFLEAQG